MEIGLANFVICVKSERNYNIDNLWDLRRYSLTKIEYFERRGYEFSRIFEMNITFITGLGNMTFEHFLEQPKHMVQWTPNK